MVLHKQNLLKFNYNYVAQQKSQEENQQKRKRLIAAKKKTQKGANEKTEVNFQLVEENDSEVNAKVSHLK